MYIGEDGIDVLITAEQRLEENRWSGAREVIRS
jgi:hypothetical protein